MSGTLSVVFTHPVFVIIEVIVGAIVVYIVYKRNLAPKPKKEIPITDEQIEEKLRAFNPEPLHQELSELQILNLKAPLVESAPDAHIIIEGKSVLNMITTNYLGLVSDSDVKEAAEKALKKYGCGSCGPRGFYGTIDVHLELEEKLAQFMETEDAIIYSSSFATMSSIVPAFSKREDILFCDKGINFALKTGVSLSRSNTKWFDHNDMEQLESALKENLVEDQKKKRKPNRRFLVIEGLYQNYGDLAPLKKIMELKEKYCFRIIMEDSHAFGVLGKNGRGTTEHLGIQPREIEIIVSSLGNSVASSAGFCCASKDIVAHQRLNGSGYIFSASTPPYLASAAIESLHKIVENPELLSSLQSNIKFFLKEVREVKGASISSVDCSPLIHIRVAVPAGQERIAIEKKLQDIVEKAFEVGIALSRAKYVAVDVDIPDPSICVTLSAKHTESELSNAALVIKKLFSETF
eukprot:TRINITY_DN4248_c0_g1_i1.p1 TRINITY_DN4248_c0_g1~~TRINITY_DN4248_c0_g1_i1.p1  ORF type:complete len:464 (+),score=209.65 TRINITY_DN4248_c0_g1_i1:573-1964(+)